MLDTTVEWDNFNINIRTVMNDEVFNGFKMYYKSLSPKNSNNPTGLIKTKRDIGFSSKLKRKKYKNKRINHKSNFSLDIESLTVDSSSVNSIYYLKTNDLVNLKIEYNKLEKSELYENGESKELFRVQYNDFGLPINFSSNSLLNTNLNYDINGRLISWKRGYKLKEEYVYDLKGRLIEVKYNNGDSLKYSYAEGILVSVEINFSKSFQRYNLNLIISQLQLLCQIVIIMFCIEMILVIFNK